MGRKKKNVNETNIKEDIVKNGNVNSIISEDKNNIEDATDEAIKNVNSVAYADNLVPPNKSSKSIRSLKIKEKNNDVINENKDTDTNDKTNENKLVEESENNKKYVIDSPSDNLDNKNVEVSTVSKKSHKTFIILSLAFLVIVLLFLLFSTVFALINSYSTKIINGITIKDIDVSGLTKEQALEKVSTAFNKKLSQDITLKHNEYETTIFPEQFGVSFELENAVNVAYSKGRTRKYFSK